MTFSFLSSAAYPPANLSIPPSYAIQAGSPATIDCQIMPGRLHQYYSVSWWKGNLSIAKSNPHSVDEGYQLHDNFSLTINDVQLSDSSSNYRCSVTINDPRTTNVVFEQLGNITVMLYGTSHFLN